MSDEKIEPALSAEEAELLANGHLDRAYQIEVAASRGDFVRVMALANAALDDEDPRKITPGKLHMMRVIGEAMQEMAKQSDDVGVGIERIMAGGSLKDFADALASYLPLEPPRS